jgi:hypothetical protein
MTMKRNSLMAGALTSIAALATGPSQAYSIDQPHFQVDPVVIVWAASDLDGASPVVVDFIVSDNGADTDLVNLDGRTLMSNQLTPTSDAVSSVALGNLIAVDDNGVDIVTVDTENPANFSAFGLNDSLTLESSVKLENKTDFYVASNAAFNISAQASALVQTGSLDLSSINLRLLSASTGSTSGLS